MDTDGESATHADIEAMQARLFDPRFLALSAARATRIAQDRPGADFLLSRARDDLALRLATIQRPFPRALDLFSPGDGASDALVREGRALLRARMPFATATDGLAADPDALPFAAQSFDLVVSLLALQWCEDLPGLLLQIRQALAPDGLFLACFVGGRTLHELRASFAQAQAEVEGGASPHVIPFADVRDAGALLQRAGFALPVADIDTVVVRYASMFALMADLRAMGATNPLRERVRHFMRRATLFRAAEVYAERFADPDGRIRATFDLVWLSGWAPHGSQQKPLRPGSARRSLAEALGTREISVSPAPDATPS